MEPDQTIARALHQFIETFKAPKEFETDGQRLSFRVFRDREELVARDLSTSIQDALKDSHYLIVPCSRRTPLSPWCQKEIELFRSYHGDERIIPVLIEGEVEESFPSALKNLKSQDDDGSLQDILAADIRANEFLQDHFEGYEALQNSNPEKLKTLMKESLSLLKIEKYRITSIKEYNVNGYLSRDGKTIIIDQNYYVNYDIDNPDQNINERTAAVYKLLEEDEVEKIIDQILGDRELTDEEKVQIGISVNQQGKQ